MGRFLPPDHTRGDEHTLGGYIAVHSRPAAFEGSDGLAYSVSIETDETGDPEVPVGAFLFFVRWGAGDPRVAGHLETDFLARAASPDEARERVGALRLAEVKAILDALIRSRRQPTGRGEQASGRAWWEAMQDEDE